MKAIYKIPVLLIGITSAVCAHSTNNSQNNKSLSGYCDGPDTRVCKITSEGSTAMGDWVETKKLSDDN